MNALPFYSCVQQTAPRGLGHSASDKHDTLDGLSLQTTQSLKRYEFNYMQDKDGRCGILRLAIVGSFSNLQIFQHEYLEPFISFVLEDTKVTIWDTILVAFVRMSLIFVSQLMR